MKNFIGLILLFCFSTLAWADDFNPSTFIIKNREKIADHLVENRDFDQIGLDKGPALSHLQEGSIYNRIFNQLEENYETIGQNQIKRLNKGQGLAASSNLNHVGINYHKDFINFYAKFKREVTPNLYDETKHIVVDTLDIYVDADRLLSNLYEEDAIDITNIQLAAYAGITFKRTYRYIHFADSFLSGLSKNLDKLFFSFRLFRGPNSYLKMNPYEYISQEDSMTIKTGVGVSAPLGTGLDISIGASAEFHRISKLEVQAIGPNDRGRGEERFRISFEKERGKSLMGAGAIQLDFFNLLNLSLFKYEFSYNYFASQRIHLSFGANDLAKLRDSDDPLGRETRRFLLNGKGDLNILTPYLISTESKREVGKKSRYALLHQGKLKECKTTQVQVVKDNKIKSFFRHNYNRIAYKT